MLNASSSHFDPNQTSHPHFAYLPAQSEWIGCMRRTPLLASDKPKEPACTIGMLVMPSPELRFEAADAPSRFRAGIRLTEIVLSLPAICARGQVAQTANAQYEAIRFSMCPDP
jgi:hypothetical protein